jgi:DNA-directed RNA polymerase I subunit RPA43
MAASSGLPAAVLERLVGEPNSCVTRVTAETHLALPPSCLADLAAGVAQHFAGHTNRYYPPLRGILLGLRRPILTARTAHLINDQPHVHLDVRAEFFMFKPGRGTLLAGVVNRRSADHLGCLVHGTFNVALTGRRTEQEGEAVTIEVTALSYGRDSLPLIQGRPVQAEGEGAAYDSGIEVKSEDGTQGKRKREEEQCGEAVKRVRVEDEEFKANDKEIKKKKKKKGKVKEEVLSESEIKQEPETEAKVKKKKKGKAWSVLFCLIKFTLPAFHEGEQD